MTKRHRVVVLGGGYAGVRAARDLALAAVRAPLEVILVSQSRWHLEKPALYEVATAYLGEESSESSERVRASVAVPLAAIFARIPVSIVIGQVVRLDQTERLVHLKDGQRISYDDVIIAVGTHVATHAVPGVAEHAFSVGSLADALALRYHILRQFRMRRATDAGEASSHTFVVVGGGSTGVEVAAELAACVAHECERAAVERHAVRVVLVEASPSVLPQLSARLRERAVQRLQSLGVEIKLGQSVTHVDEGSVGFADGSRLPTRTVIWAGGLAAPSWLAASGLPTRRWGLATERTMRVVGCANVWAAGDCAVLVDYPEAVPAAVPVAYAQGSVVAENVLRHLMGQPLEAFVYRTVGALITIGGKEAIAVLPRGKGFAGRLPWLLKRVVSLRYWLWYLPWPEALRFWYHSLVLHSQND